MVASQRGWWDGLSWGMECKIQTNFRFTHTSVTVPVTAQREKKGQDNFHLLIQLDCGQNQGRLDDMIIKRITSQSNLFWLILHTNPNRIWASITRHSFYPNTDVIHHHPWWNKEDVHLLHHQDCLRHWPKGYCILGAWKIGYSVQFNKFYQGNVGNLNAIDCR